MFLSFDKSRKCWYAYYTDSNGIRKRVSTKTSDKFQAIKFIKNFIPEDKPLRTITLLKAEAEFMKLHTFNKKEKTTKGYELTFRFFSEAMGMTTPLNTITAKDIRLFLIGRHSTASIYQARKDRIHLNCFFQFFVGEYIQENPVKTIKARDFKLPEKFPLFYSEEETEKLFADMKDKEIRDLCIFALNTGMRQGEILELKWRQVDLKRKLVVLTNQEHLTKTNAVRSIPLNDKAVHVLLHRQMLISQDFVFLFSGRRIKPNNLEHRLNRHLKNCSLNPRYNFHTLRHTFASWLVQRGVPLLVVSQLLGHKSVKTTQIYAHLAPSNKQDAVDLL